MLRQLATGAALLASCAVMAFGQAVPVTVTYTYSGYPVWIAPDDYDVISIANIVVPNALKMTKVTATVNVEYSQVGDLNLYLYSPDGTRTKLLERNCGSIANVTTTFDDAAGQRFSEACPTGAGASFRGNEPLSNFNNADSSLGVWRIAVENNGSDTRTGWLKNFALTITGTTQLTPTFRAETVFNAAGNRNGAIAPGERISIIGIGVGPGTPATAPAGSLPTTLGGVRVTMNGTDIPLSYVSAFRIDAQVPFGLSTSGPASVQIRNGDQTSATVSLVAQPTAPGIFAIDPNGQGPAKAYNQSGKLNTPLEPAVAGEIITFYASGLGAVAPATAAGQPGPSSTLSVVSVPVAASIGGLPATVTFAGLAPGYIGIYQVNVQVPQGVAPGVRDLVISSGGNASQSGCTVAVR